MRRFVSNTLEASGQQAPRPTRSQKKSVSRFIGTSLLMGLAAATTVVAQPNEAQAQEIQLTGPLAGAPAVRKLREHRKGRFEIAPSVSFTLLDEYQRTIMPGLRLNYHPTDWLGLGVWGGYGFQYSTGLTDELQDKAIDKRQCDKNPASRACRLTAGNLTRKGVGETGTLTGDQLGRMQWVAAPQITVVPFRGKFALFSSLFVDTDVNFFVGPAFVGLQERKDCGADADGKGLTPCNKSFELDSRVAIAPTFGLGLNFYPGSFIGFGVEWRALPYAWNTGGFDTRGSGTNEDFPDNNVNSKDREFKFNSLVTLNLTIQLPTAIKSSE